MDVISTLALLYPDFSQVDEALQQTAIQVARDHAPKCLPPEKQDLAVAYYAAYLLAQQAESGINPHGLSSEREGDLSVTYSLEQRKSAQFLAKWQELNEICVRLGSITVGLNYVGYR